MLVVRVHSFCCSLFVLLFSLQSHHTGCVLSASFLRLQPGWCVHITVQVRRVTDVTVRHGETLLLLCIRIYRTRLLRICIDKQWGYCVHIHMYIYIGHLDIRSHQWHRNGEVMGREHSFINGIDMGR